MGRSQDLYLQAKTMIPGGTQLLSKRPEMFLPGFWPAYYSRSSGCDVWDLDGKKYVDMSFMGVGACILGYADKDVNKAVKTAVDKGSMTTLNAPEEVELAQELLQLHSWANMVRYTKTGGEAMAVAVRIARARAKKDVVLFCGYHGWHDWYLSANLASDSSLDGHLLPGLDPRGVPRCLEGTALPFLYNDTKGFLKLIERHKGNVGVIVLEPIRNEAPRAKFLKTLRRTATRMGIVLVVDEITAGWRLTQGGAHLLFDLVPDIAVFGKGISNGYPMAAVIGKKEVMEAAQESFISSTYWTDRVGPAAAVATIRKMRSKKVHAHLISVGKKVKQGWGRLGKKHGLAIHIGGMDPLGHFRFEHAKPLVLKTLFTQFMLERGFLATTAFYASYAHKDVHVARYLKAADASFLCIAKAVGSGDPEKYLKGPVCHGGFKRLT